MMNTEFSSRKSRQQQKAQQNQPLSLDDVLTKPQTPDFLKNAKLIEEEQLRKQVLSKMQQEKTTQDAVIAKPAQVSKKLVELNETTKSQKYENFVNYMELRRLAGDESAQVETVVQESKRSMRMKGEDNEEDDDGEEQEEESGGHVPQRAGLGFTEKVSRPNGIAKGGQRGKGNQKGGVRKPIKDKERAKRMKGQSSQSSWKPEEFMKLRQGYD